MRSYRLPLGLAGILILAAGCDPADLVVPGVASTASVLDEVVVVPGATVLPEMIVHPDGRWEIG